ncbi:ankyrin repeat domain-containing protein [Pyxidicoccus xibeiensis]|uniref:ankyrin repeat domain-containing protein n=1 Tax=Pyxidicoccus xibeiensis TaxID=2906759 RepID=UPI0020A7BC21|nr:ankyrin repeat domain-containing protein [Pyxidicoccus xibeiensis]MCP3140346.1 ankyrin repeat domain-containing protein [Pyxidicoccus xibeiensis]
MSRPKKVTERCRDCAVAGGKLHEPFCPQERCPYCGGQLASCDCIFDVLQLDDAERRAVDEYVDDTVEPLRGIMERWWAALESKGRRPFQPLPPNDPGRVIHAVLTGRVADVRALQQAGFEADVAREDGYTLLMAAVLKERVDLVEYLLGAGADPNARTASGERVLGFALRSRDTPSESSDPTEDRQAQCVRLLLRHGADPNAAGPDGHTPLMEAAWWGALGAARAMLDAGADATRKDARSRTACALAREQGHARLAALLEGAMKPASPR